MNELQVSAKEIPAVFYSEKYQQDVTTSLAIARDFEKQPKNVLRDIDELIEVSKELREEIKEQLKIEPFKNELTEDEKLLMKVDEMFFEGIYYNKNNKPCRIFYMNRDGFTLLAFKFTGKKALLWKLKYLQLFNRLEDFYYSTHQVEQNIQQPVVDPYKFSAVQQIELQKEKNEYLKLQNRSMELQIEMKKVDMQALPEAVDTVLDNSSSNIGETQRQELNRKVKEFQKKKGNIQHFQAWQIFYNALDNYLDFQVESKRAKAAKELNKKNYSKVEWLEDHHLLPQAIIVIDALIEQLNQPANNSSSQI